MSVLRRFPLAPAPFCALAVLALSATAALLSSGVYYDDDLAHYLIARFSWQHPELLLDTWGRPAFTLLYAPAAALGFVPARLFSALLLAATALAAARLAELHGVRRPWLAVLLVGLQPELLRQGFSTLTELVFALLLTLALIAARQERWAPMALAAGWLPLARYESLPLVAAFGLLLLARRRWGLVPLLAAPLLLQNGFHALREGQPALLLFPLDQLFGLRASAPSFDYGLGDPLYYLQRAPEAYGAAIFALCVLGMLRVRFGLLQASVLITVAVLCFSYWRLTEAGVAGYVRHLAVVAAPVGVLAALGAERIAERPAQRWRLVALAALGAGLALWLGGRGMFAGALVALVAALAPIMATRARSQTTAQSPRKRKTDLDATPLQASESERTNLEPSRWPLLRELDPSTVLAIAVAALAIVSAPLAVRPFELNNEQRVALEAGRWLRDNNHSEQLVLGSHIWLQHGAALDPFEPARFRNITPDELAAAPVGTVVAWDSHYSHRLVWRTPLELLQDPARFQPLKSWQEADFQLYLFEKVAPSQ